MVIKLNDMVVRLYKEFGKRGFVYSDTLLASSTLMILVKHGLLTIHQKATPDKRVMFYLSKSALETFAPTVSWWAD